MELFKDRLQYVIDFKKYSQRQVADGFGVDETRVSKWLSGAVKKPHRKTIQKLAIFFSCEFKWLADNEGNPFAPSTTETAETKNNYIGEVQSKNDTSSKEIILSEGVSMTETVLLSNTSYADALWANLKSFAKAVETENDMNELKEDMRKMEKTMSDKMERMEKLLLSLGATAHEKRDKEANS